MTIIVQKTIQSEHNNPVMKKKLTARQKTIFAYVSETILWIAFLLCPAIAVVMTEKAPEVAYILTVCALFPYVLIFLHHGLRGKVHKVITIADFVCTGLFAVIGVVFLILQRSDLAITIFYTLFFAIFLIRRIIRLILFHKLRELIFGILMSVVLGSFITMAYSDLTPAFCLLLLDGIFVLIAICNIVVLAFSRIRLGLLIRIIRKTYVAEIIFGLLTLIFVFSLIFYGVDDGFTSYGDALWYSFALVTTVGFGDFTAKGLICRLLSVVLGIYGIIVVAAITSVIVNFYQESSKEDEMAIVDAPVTMDEVSKYARNDFNAPRKVRVNDAQEEAATPQEPPAIENSEEANPAEQPAPAETDGE